MEENERQSCSTTGGSIDGDNGNIMTPPPLTAILSTQLLPNGATANVGELALNHELCRPLPQRDEAPATTAHNATNNNSNIPLVFLSHTGRDGVKEEICRPTHWFLTHKVFGNNNGNQGQVFFDDASMPAGQEKTLCLLQQAHRCTHAVVILSPSFRYRKYCVMEINTFMVRRFVKRNDNLTVIPVLWNLDQAHGYAPAVQELGWIASRGLRDPADFMVEVLWPFLMKQFAKGATSESTYKAWLVDYVTSHRGRGRVAIPPALERFCAREQDRATSQTNAGVSPQLVSSPRAHTNNHLTWPLDVWQRNHNDDDGSNTLQLVLEKISSRCFFVPQTERDVAALRHDLIKLPDGSLLACRGRDYLWEDWDHGYCQKQNNALHFVYASGDSECLAIVDVDFQYLVHLVLQQQPRPRLEIAAAVLSDAPTPPPTTITTVGNKFKRHHDGNAHCIVKTCNSAKLIHPGDDDDNTRWAWKIWVEPGTVSILQAMIHLHPTFFPPTRILTPSRTTVGGMVFDSEVFNGWGYFDVEVQLVWMDPRRRRPCETTLVHPLVFYPDALINGVNVNHHDLHTLSLPAPSQIEVCKGDGSGGADDSTDTEHIV